MTTELVTTLVTAQQVIENCPERLRVLAKEIRVRFEKAEQCEEKADQHRKSAVQRLVEARDACDDGGFTAFRERFFPQLGPSRAYELMQIASNKKTEEEVRAETRERVQRHRAKKATSVTVTESALLPVVQQPGALTGSETDNRTKSGPGVNPRDELSHSFTTVFLELARLTKKQNAARFIKTFAPGDDLARVGELLTTVARLKNLGGSPPPDTNALSTEHSIDNPSAVKVPDDDQQAAA